MDCFVHHALKHPNVETAISDGWSARAGLLMSLYHVPAEVSLFIEFCLWLFTVETDEGIPACSEV